jgi:hypothetical protein
VSVTVEGGDVEPIFLLPKLIDVGANPAPAWVPVTVRATAWGLAGAVSVKFKFDDRKPVAPGVAVTPTAHVALTASVVMQVFDEIEKSPGLLPPPTATALIVSAAVPEFFTVTESGAVGDPTV